MARRKKWRQCMNSVHIGQLMKLCGINHEGRVLIEENMSDLEPDPKDDWLYVGINSMRMVKKKIKSAAIIGSGNGIDAIAALKIFNLEKLYVTDLISEILPNIRRNIELNSAQEIQRTEVKFLVGRDCEPLEETVDLIYANLPILMVEDEKTTGQLATTTLTSAKAYETLAKDENDPLRRFSLLSQLGFLLSAKEKLNKDGSIVTLIGGRIPYEVIEECFKRAGLEFRRIYAAFMRQSDPQFLRQYAQYSKATGVEFEFYDYEKAIESVLIKYSGIPIPGIMSIGYGDFRSMISKSRITAAQAYRLYQKHKDVGHIAFSFQAKLPEQF